MANIKITVSKELTTIVSQSLKITERQAKELILLNIDSYIFFDTYKLPDILWDIKMDILKKSKNKKVKEIKISVKKDIERSAQNDGIDVSIFTDCIRTLFGFGYYSPFPNSFGYRPPKNQATIMDCTFWIPLLSPFGEDKIQVEIEQEKGKKFDIINHIDNHPFNIDELPIKSPLVSMDELQFMSEIKK